MLIEAGERTEQPLGPVAPAPQWAARGLAFLANAASNVDTVGGLPIEATTRSATPGGIGYGVAAGAHSVVASHRMPPGTDELTVVAWGYTSAANNPGADPGQIVIFAGPAIWYASALRFETYAVATPGANVYYYPDYSGSIQVVSPSSIGLGPHVLAMRYRRNASFDLWVDGAQVASSAVGNIQAGLAAGSDYRIGVSTFAERQMATEGAAVFLSALTDDELRALAINPWQLFEPQGAAWAPPLFATPSGPTITDEPDAQIAAEGDAATFSVAATSSGGTLTYQWQVNDGSGFVNVSGGSGASSASYTTPALAYAADGWNTYRCVVSDDNGSVNSAAVVLQVLVEPSPTRLLEHLFVGGLFSDGPAAAEIQRWEAFGALPVSGAITLKTWDGSAWVAKPVKVWTGAAWEAKTVKVWNGSSWV